MTHNVPKDVPEFHVSTPPKLFFSQNIVFVKPTKVGGSTFGGVMRRISAHHGISGYDDDHWIESQPGIWANHETRMSLQHQMDASFGRTLFATIVRYPTSRCLSYINHFIVNKKYHRERFLSTEDKIKVILLL